MLTGTTGFLGVNLLHYILKYWACDLHLIVRSTTHVAAVERLEKNYYHFFKEKFLAEELKRIKIYLGDLADGQFNLSDTDYINLSYKIDCIINSAATVKYYGSAEVFEKNNVLSSINLAKFSLLNKVKDFHHLSTLSIGSGKIKDLDITTFTEYDFDKGQHIEVPYAQSKYVSEKELLKYRNQGAKINIYRIGNIVCDSQTGIFQNNIGQ